ncbi:MAG TPA: hypothetical protein V6D19_14875 [Stenomitos sp.]
MQQVQRLTEEVSHQTEAVADYLKLVEELGEPRSLWHPFGSDPLRVEAAKTALHESCTEFYLAKQQLEGAQAQFESWQRPATQAKLGLKRRFSEKH